MCSTPLLRYFILQVSDPNFIFIRSLLLLRVAAIATPQSSAHSWGHTVIYRSGSSWLLVAMVWVCGREAWSFVEAGGDSCRGDE
jgi:hypothetical protein